MYTSPADRHYEPRAGPRWCPSKYTLIVSFVVCCFATRKSPRKADRKRDLQTPNSVFVIWETDFFTPPVLGGVALLDNSAPAVYKSPVP